MAEPVYIQVILPLALPALYTYAVPAGWEPLVAPGKRVEVEFGRRKRYAALVHSAVERPKDVRYIKPILSVLDDAPILQPWQIGFWEWLADYYLCTLGEVMQAALPAALKLDSESTFCRNPDADYDQDELSDEEYLICEAFDFQDELRLEDIQQIVGKKSVFGLIRGLVQKRILYIRETLAERYRPRLKAFVELTPEYRGNEPALQALLDGLSRAPKQEALVLAWLDLAAQGASPVEKAAVLERAGASSQALNALADKGVFRVEYHEVDRLEMPETGGEDHSLEKEQAEALESLRGIYQDKSVALLHGITSSGKTHVYIELIKEYAVQGKQVLYLVPEIALTSQLISRLRRWLGDIGVYHSKFNDAERVEIWNKVLDGRYRIVVGARSAMFLPFADLGFVVVDEEHDHSYKQYDPAPRYQARDAAVYLATLHGAKVLLGSATPSYESYFHARRGKYGFVALKRRYGGITPPEIRFADLRRSRQREEMQGPLTPDLAGAIEETLAAGRQVILFQNRRGYAPYLACAACNWIPKCRHCDVSLTYHKFSDDLRCHYCGYREGLIRKCRECGHEGMELRGMGTERIEDDLKVIYPRARIARMDLDAVRTKHGHEKVIGKLERRETDILIGTQMVTKGLDFGHVRLVGVLNADALLYFPDFRALERAYQLLMQVSGRSGRRGEQGLVIIQLSDRRHPIVHYLVDDTGYEDLYRQEMADRRTFGYPPFVRLMRIVVRHRDARVAARAATRLAASLRSAWGGRIIGPVAPVIARVKSYYLQEITVKCERKGGNLNALKASISAAIQELDQHKEFASVRVHTDVDPY